MAVINSSSRDEDSSSSSSSLATSFFVDPYSEQAKQELSTFYAHHNLIPGGDNNGNIDTVHKSLLRLTECVISWNEKVNLVSRKECTPTAVYHKHVLPSVALLPLVLSSSSFSSSSLDQQQQQDQTKEAKYSSTPPSLQVIDIGTGGGFPGLPLALLLPQHQFTLVDSIRKKLVAVSDMASELNISNVRIHCGRAEEMKQGHTGRYHVVLGRSVTALPNFCSWVQDLIKREGVYKNSGSNNNNNNNINFGKQEIFEGGGGGDNGGRLIYIIGGEIDDMVQSKIVSDTPIDTLLQRSMNTSDKRALVFTARGVREIAREVRSAKREKEEEEEMRMAGTKKNNGQRRNVQNNHYGGGSNNNNNYRKKLIGGGREGGVDKRGAEERRGGGLGTGRNNKPARGAWSEKRNDGVVKQRGYDDFQRYESS